jgi:RNA polymerase sigma factor (sigma-70 family)
MARTQKLNVGSEEMSNFHSIGQQKKVKLKVKEKFIDINQHLVDACKRNDAQAQQELYQKYCNAMFNTCKRMIGNREDAQDVLQDSFIAAFKSIDNFNGTASFGAWLKRIVINKCINHLNRKKKIQFESISNQTEGEFHEDAERELEFSTQQINDAISKLPTGCRMVFVMKAMEGFDHGEIAQALEIKVGTSKSQFNRARTLLQESLMELLNN